MGAGSSSGKERDDAVQNGSDLGYEELVSRYGDEVYSLCLNLTRSSAESEQVLNEVFVQAVSELEQIADQNVSLTHAMYRLAIGQVAERERVRHPQLASPIDGAEAFPPPNDDLTAMVRTAVQALPYEYRVVYILREMLALSVESTADVLEISPIEVRAFMHRARLMVCRGVQRLRQGATELPQYDPAEIAPTPESLIN